WNSPHRVTFKGHDKFYSRSSNGKYPLDVAELRTAFNISESITDRIRKFRENRLAKIFANEIHLHPKAKIVLHLLPIISFAPAKSYDISKIVSNPSKITTISGPIPQNILNFDGFLAYSSYSYTQLFRNGIIEAVYGLRSEEIHKEKLIFPTYEEKLIEALDIYLSTLKSLGVVPPIFVSLALHGVKGYSMDYENNSTEKVQRIDRDVLLIPEVLVESYNVSVKDVLRLCFNSIWNACGYPRSFNYDDKGKWVESKSK
ncbi:unnamed protein product, partial [marine sediment metagenome]